MNNSQKIELLESNLKRLHSLINSADNKIGLVLGIDTAMLGFLVASASKKYVFGSIVLLFISISCILILVSLFMVSLASFPRTSGSKNSIIFFKSVSTYDLDQYQDRIVNLTNEIYFEDLIHQCYYNAKITSQKFKWVRYSMFSLYFSIIPWLICLFLLYKK